MGSCQPANRLLLIIPVKETLLALHAKLKDLDSPFGSLLWADVARRHPNSISNASQQAELGALAS